LLEFFPVPLLVGLIPLAALLPALIRQKRGPGRIAGIVLFYVYLLLVLGAEFFPVPVGAHDRQSLPDLLRSPNLNLVPFYFGPHTDGFERQIAAGCLLNLLLTVPFGFAIGFFRPLKSRDLLWLAPAVGLGLEFAQFLACLAFGGYYRSVDINDSLFNAVGIVVGYGLFRVFVKQPGAQVAD
jgi:glycopeptide antibiotics resistance protein